MPTLTLPKLDYTQAITEGNGIPTLTFHIWWQTVAKALEVAYSTLQTQVDAINAALAAAEAAQNAADTATASAAAAQNAADSSNAVASLTNSGVTGVTITATDAGSNVTVTVSSHTRVYGDGSTVSVSSGSVTGLSYSTAYYIYYDDPSRAGGTVTYQATTSMATASQTGDRHLVGVVTTPAAAGAPVDGDFVPPPGIGTLP